MSEGIDCWLVFEDVVDLNALISKNKKKLGLIKDKFYNGQEYYKYTNKKEYFFSEIDERKMKSHTPSLKFGKTLLSISSTLRTKDYHSKKWAVEFVDIIIKTLKIIKPLIIWADKDHNFEIQLDDYKNVFWLNFFGPKIIEKIGKKKLLDTPAYKVVELNEDWVFIQASPYPFDLNMKERHTKAKIEIAKHLEFEEYLKKEKEKLVKCGLKSEYVEELFK